VGDPNLDFDAAEARFAASVDGTVGIEEELQLLDPSTLDLVPRYEELRDAGQADPVLAQAIAGELISSEIEIRSGKGDDVHRAIEQQRAARRALVALAGDRGVALGATGTHPWADYREQPNIDTEHYRRVVDGLQYVARRNNTWSVHVHVGVRDLDRAVRVCDRLRGVLPTLLALSASSPFLDARDSGLHSARTQAFTRTFPRCGIPEAFGSWQAFRAFLELLVRTGSIVEYTQVWFSVRPHLAFGTVEVRICDAQPDAADGEALAQLVTACVLQAARDLDEGVPFEDPAPRLVEENLWRAIRHGMDGELLDLERLEVVPAPAAVEALLAWTAPVRAEHRIDPALPAQTAAQRQRRMLAAGAGMREVFEAAVRETAESYAPQEARTP
jgi:glutamate---cysteine ligase / carboxylate-amine ligase